ncbi:MAG: hypothetical protein HYT79_01485 [Elusimicrobia bacterium]|nr:hypothetical protein [Elusimicrobiota bacterium]
MRINVRFIFYFLYGAIFISLLYPENNPDLFWHLAAGRKAQAMGRWLLDQELFSFTQQGAPWVNYEWLFEMAVWKLYRWGDFRALVLARAALILLAIVAADRYLVHRLGWRRAAAEPWRVAARSANILMTHAFLASRATMQPELFTFVCLPVFFLLFDKLAAKLSKMRADQETYLLAGLYCLLFSLWANIHGGFVWALGYLAILFGAEILAWINAWHRSAAGSIRSRARGGEDALERRRRLTIVAFAALAAFAATLVNPYGIKLYEVIVRHMKDAPFIATAIHEWQPTRIDHPLSWHYWGALPLAVGLLIALWAATGRLRFFGILLVGAFGLWAARHVRNLAVFGLVSLPILWEALRDAAPWLLARWDWPLKGQRRFVVLLKAAAKVMVLLMVASGVGYGGYFLGERVVKTGRNLWNYRGIPKAYLAAGKYPELAFGFLERNPELLRLNIWVEWGWGGFASWRLHDQGARFFMDGRYIFHHELKELFQRAARPDQWTDYLKQRQVDLCVMHHPDAEAFLPVHSSNAASGKPGYAVRSWHGLAYPQSDWALIWWDGNAMVLLRRDRWPAGLPKTLEYKSRLIIDPHQVENQVRRQELNPDVLVKEIGRNMREAGLNTRNANLLRVVAEWGEGRF